MDVTRNPSQPGRGKLPEIFPEQGFGVSAGRRFSLGIAGVTIVRKVPDRI
jgi:hypothetical protein